VDPPKIGDGVLGSRLGAVNEAVSALGGAHTLRRATPVRGTTALAAKAGVVARTVKAISTVFTAQLPSTRTTSLLVVTHEFKSEPLCCCAVVQCGLRPGASVRIQ
jgi:hypothetical protein